MSLVLAGCGGSSGTDSPDTSVATSTIAPSPSLSGAGDVVSGQFDVGGKKIFAECKGSGSPTVLMESGDEGDHYQWVVIAQEIAQHTRTCVYDRLGTGKSEDPTGCRQLADLRGDLEAVLTEVGEDGPYVLVGTSGGGFLMAGFAYEHPADVQGIVLLETPHAIVPEQVPPSLLEQIKCDNPTNVERRDYVSVENEAWSNRREIGDIPMTVVTNDYLGQGENEEERTNVEGQQGWLVLSPQAQQILVTSGHNVPANEPKLAMAEILKVVEAARAG